MLESCAWTTWLRKLPGKSIMSASNVEFDWDPESLREIYPVKGPALNIPLKLVIKAIKLMKCGKAAGTPLVVVEMMKACGVERAQQICDLIMDIIHLRKIPTQWEESFIVSFYKGKGVALEQRNYRGLKLLDQAGVGVGGGGWGGCVSKRLTSS